MKISIDSTTKQIEIDGKLVSLQALEEAAHQDDPLWLYYRGIAAPPQDAETADLAERYREIFREARAAVVAAEMAERRARIRACKVHRPHHESGPWGYTGSVADVADKENRAAHGNVGFTQHCECGAERRYLVNGQYYEWSSWA